MLMIMLAFMVSLAGSVGLVLFIEYLDNTIKNVEDVTRYVQLPALGVIPAISASAARKLASKKSGKHKALTDGAKLPGMGEFKPGQLMALDTRSTAAEAYRALRTSVLLSAAGRPPKKILVTSSQPGEGKTTTCINTAISLAQLGASVLIIDCDLRKPTTHKVFGVDHVLGLSTYLSRDVTLDGLIQKLPINNVSLLPCGPIPPNPAELISSEKMRSMLALLSERYDHILIDSPPLINVTDPVILSRMVDGVIMVVHGGKSTRYVVRRARQELTSVGAKIFGVVLNNVDLRHEGYDGYYYGRHSYSYEQGPRETAV
jgi:capsular exopolysaccharide synthesis family protein